MGSIALLTTRFDDLRPPLWRTRPHRRALLLRYFHPRIKGGMKLEILDMGECDVMISLSIGSCTRAMSSDAPSGHQGLSQSSLPHYNATHLEETVL